MSIKYWLSFVIVTLLSACVESEQSSTRESIDDASKLCLSDKYTILSATDDGTHNTDQGPSNVIDGDTDASSRWSSQSISNASKEITLDLGEVKTVSAIELFWFKGDERTSTFSIEVSSDEITWASIVSEQSSSGSSNTFEVVNFNESIETQYIKVIGFGNSSNDWNSLIEAQAYRCALGSSSIPGRTDVDIEPFDPVIPEAPLPDENGLVILPSDTGIELQDWYLSIPVDDGDGYSSSIYESQLANGYTNSDFFYGIQESDGEKGIVMVSPTRGYRTSENTYYARVELREMLRRGGSGSTKGVGNNNWVFSSAPVSSQNEAGGVDGELTVTLAVNHVTTTFGQNYSQLKEADQSKGPSEFQYQVGRVVIGQIHANDDEPIRLYYRKLPGHTNGSIYFYHEPREGNEILVDILGSKTLTVGDENPIDGIPLNQKFTYKIVVVGNDLSVVISQEGKDDVTGTLDMTDSGFDDADQYQYFKVGLYHLNNTASDDDYVQATFYEIRNSHDGYDASE